MMSDSRNIFRLAYNCARAAKLYWSYPHVRWMASRCSRDKVAIDVGANVGLYSLVLALKSAEVHAFEANPELACQLKERLALIERIHVHPYGLSDSVGEATLSVPVVDGCELPGHGTLMKIGGSVAKKHRVELRRLDDVRIANVGIIKIDVEGHELEVLSGGRSTISRDRPALLVELLEAQRKGCINEVAAYLRGLEYDGFYCAGGRVGSISTYDPTLQIYGRSTFVSDFMFLPSEERGNLGIAC